jgi:hypothetical protein
MRVRDSPTNLLSHTVGTAHPACLKGPHFPTEVWENDQALSVLTYKILSTILSQGRTSGSHRAGTCLSIRTVISRPCISQPFSGDSLSQQERSLRRGLRSLQYQSITDKVV